MDLREYEQHKFAIAEVLRQASRASPDDPLWRQQTMGLFSRLAEDRFNLVVVGRFSRGKTSMMNALLGTDRLPMGIVLLTSVITTVAYGSSARVILHYDRHFPDQEIPLEALPQYVTQQGNPGNVKSIREAEVQLPAELLRRGFHFVDTPGLGSAIEENTRTTESFLPEADAFLVVTSYESSLSDEGMRFFHAVSSSRRNIFVIVNKQDTVRDQERVEALAYVRQQLVAMFGEAPPKVFSISVREGLEAKQSEDILRLMASGIPVLEQELVKFLLTESNRHFFCACVTESPTWRADCPVPSALPTSLSKSRDCRSGSPMTAQAHCTAEVRQVDRRRNRQPSNFSRTKSAHRYRPPCGNSYASSNTKLS